MQTAEYYVFYKVSNGAKIRNRYNQVPHLTQDTNAKVANSQLDTTNESQEVSPFPADKPYPAPLHSNSNQVTSRRFSNTESLTDSRCSHYKISLTDSL